MEVDDISDPKDTDDPKWLWQWSKKLSLACETRGEGVHQSSVRGSLRGMPGVKNSGPKKTILF
jgi:hypothetical protein